MPNSAEIERYKARLAYEAKLADLMGDRYKADQIRAMNENVARINTSSDRYKVDELTKREREKEKREAGRNDIESIVGFRRAMNMQGSKDFDSMIKALEVVNKMEADRKPSNEEIAARRAWLEQRVVTDPKTGKQRKLLPEEKDELLSRSLKRSGGGSDQLRDMIMGRFGPAKGQNILNPNPPQDRSVPPSNTGSVPAGPQGAIQGATVNAIPGQAQQFSNPQQELQAYFRGIPQAQRGKAIADVKEGGLDAITNPQSTGHKFLLEKLYGLPSSAMDDQTHKQFQDYMQGKYTGGYDPQDYMWERDNFQKDNRPPVPWAPYGSKEAAANGTPQALAMEDAKWFRSVLPIEEFNRLERRVKQVDPSIENAAQGWDVTPKWYDNQPANVIDTKTRFNWYDKAGQDRLARERLASGIDTPPVEPPYEEGWSGPASVFRNIVNPRHMFGAMPSGLGGLMPGERDIYGSESVSPESGMNVDYDKGFGRVFDGEGGPSRLAFRSDAPQYSGPTQVAGDPFPPMLKFFSGGYTPEISQGLRDMNQGQHDLGMRMLRALGLVE